MPGTAEFRIFTRWSLKSTSTLPEARTVITTWYLGFQEIESGIWKIYRISKVSLANGFRAISGGLTPSSGSQISLKYIRASAFSL
jgi:hypothetical protein